MAAIDQRTGEAGGGKQAERREKRHAPESERRSHSVTTASAAVRFQDYDTARLSNVRRPTAMKIALSSTSAPATTA